MNRSVSKGNDFKGYIAADLGLAMAGQRQTILEANENLEGNEKGTVYKKNQIKNLLN